MAGGVFSIVVVLILAWVTFVQREGEKIDPNSLQLFSAAMGIAVTTWFVIFFGGRNIGVVVQSTLSGIHVGVAVTLGRAVLAGFMAFASSSNNVSNTLAAIKAVREVLLDTFSWGAALGAGIGCVVGFARRGNQQPETQQQSHKRGAGRGE